MDQTLKKKPRSAQNIFLPVSVSRMDDLAQRWSNHRLVSVICKRYVNSGTFYKSLQLFQMSAMSLLEKADICFRLLKVLEVLSDNKLKVIEKYPNMQQCVAALTMLPCAFLSAITCTTCYYMPTAV